MNCYGRATWKLVKEVKDGETHYFVRTKTPITFEEGHAPDLTKLKNGETWRLHAIYAPNGTWDASSESYVWGTEGAQSRKLYGPNEKLKIGEDIQIPFVLGYRAPGGSSSSLQWWTGYPVQAVKSTSWNFEILQQYQDPQDRKKPAKPRFRMLGSLMAIRLQNLWQKRTPLDELDKDGTIIDGLTYRPTYDFSIKGFYVESTQAVRTVKYSFKSLYKDLTSDTRRLYKSIKHSFPDDGERIVDVPSATVTETPAYLPTLSDPTRLYLSWDSHATGDDLNRNSTSKTLYFWLSEVDPTGQHLPNSQEGYGTAIWANLYNKTLQMHAGATFVYTSKSAHKSGWAYRTIVPLKEEL